MYSFIFNITKMITLNMLLIISLNDYFKYVTKYVQSLNNY